MSDLIRPALSVFVLLTALTGIVYPAVVTLVAQGTLPHRANGSAMRQEGQVIGSELIGQPFAGPRYFWGRPSATTPMPYNGAASSGSNLGPTNPDLRKAIAERVATLRAAHPDQTGPIPVDLVTASASGLDTHISPAAAEFQAGRVAQARGLTVERVRELIATHTEGRTFGLLGEPRVHVLRLNVALDTEESKVARRLGPGRAPGGGAGRQPVAPAFH